MILLNMRGIIFFPLIFFKYKKNSPKTPPASPEHVTTSANAAALPQRGVIAADVSATNKKPARNLNSRRLVHPNLLAPAD